MHTRNPPSLAQSCPVCYEIGEQLGPKIISYQLIHASVPVPVSVCTANEHVCGVLFCASTYFYSTFIHNNKYIACSLLREYSAPHTDHTHVRVCVCECMSLSITMTIS